MPQRDERESFNPTPTVEEETEKVRRARRLRTEIDSGEAWIQYCWNHWRVRCDSVEAAIDLMATRGLTNRDMHLSALMAVANLEFTGGRGDTKANIYLSDRYMGAIDTRSYADRVNQMSEPEIDAELTRVFGLKQDQREAAMARLSDRDEL
jgi:hypothetical protein